MEVRIADGDDVTDIVALHAGLVAEDAGTRDPLANLDWPAQEGLAYFTAALADESVRCFVAEADGTTVGFLLGRLSEPSRMRPYRVAELESTFVRADHRGTGIGGTLVARFTAWAKEREATAARVSAYASNEAAQRFYARAGFGPKYVIMQAPI